MSMKKCCNQNDELEMNSIPAIQYIKRKDLNETKYNTCIAQSLNSRIYAFSWYLDVVADFWDVLVFGDYEVVMPIPKLKLKRHLWFPKIYMPPFVQQLGIFGIEKIEVNLIERFVDNFKKLNPKIYHFNSKNFDIQNVSLNTLPNYQLNLHQSYQAIYTNYSTNLKRKLKKKRLDFSIESIHEKSTIIKFYTEFGKPKMNQKIIQKFNNLYDVLKKKDKVEVYGFYFQSELLSIAIFLNEPNYLVNILPISNEDGNKYNAMSLLLDFVIQKNAEKNISLDFEGSSIEGIANFYKSFGAVNNPYLQFKSNSFF